MKLREKRRAINSSGIETWRSSVDERFIKTAPTRSFTRLLALLRLRYPARCAIPYKAVGAVIVPMQRASLSRRCAARRFPRAGFLYIRAQSTTRKVASRVRPEFPRAWFLRLGSHRPTGIPFTVLRLRARSFRRPRTSALKL